MMRAGVCVLLVLGLLVVLGEGFYVQQQQQQNNDDQQFYLSDSNESQNENGAFIDDPEVAQLWQSEEEPDETQENDSFIAPESTEEGELWASEDDPDWTPSQSQEEQSQYDDDYYSNEDDNDDDYEDQGQTEYSQEQQSQEDQSQQNSVPFPDVQESNEDDWSQQVGQDYHHMSKRNVKYPQTLQFSSPYNNNWYRPEGGVSAGVEPLVSEYGPKTDQVGDGVEPESDNGYGGSRFGNWFRRGWRKLTDTVGDTVGYIGDKVDYVAGKVHKKLENLDEKWDRIKYNFKTVLKKFGILVQEGVSYCLRRFQNSYNKLRESEVIEKLQQKLDEGHADVAKFFQILGKKFEIWREEQGSDYIDAGLLEGYEQGQQQGGQYEEGQQQGIPDFYQDQDVITQLNILKDDGVLTQNEIWILTSEHTNQQN